MITIKGTKYSMNKKRNSFEITFMSKNVVKVDVYDFISNPIIHKKYTSNDIYTIFDFNGKARKFYLKLKNQLLYTKPVAPCWTAYPSSSANKKCIESKYTLEKTKFLDREGLIYKSNQELTLSNKIVTLVNSRFLEDLIDKEHIKNLMFSSRNFINENVENFDIVAKSEKEFENEKYLSFEIDEIIV